MKLHQAEAGKTVRVVDRVYGQPILSDCYYVVIGPSLFTNLIGCRVTSGIGGPSCWEAKVWLAPDLDVAEVE